MPDSEALDLESLLRHSDWLTSLARRLVVSSRADDLVQDTWLAALRNPPHAVRSPRAPTSSGTTAPASSPRSARRSRIARSATASPR